MWHGWLQSDNNKFTQEYGRKTLQLQGLVRVFEKLSGERQRLARKKVVTTYYHYLKKNSKPTEYTTSSFKDHPVYNILDFDKSVLPYVEQVRADFEEISVMVKNDLVDRDAYFDAYWGSMLRCYMAIHGYIETTREKYGTKHHTAYLEEQSEKYCLDYWREKHPDAKIIFYSDEPEETSKEDSK